MNFGDWVVAGLGLISGVVLWIIIAAVAIFVILGSIAGTVHVIRLMVRQRGRHKQKWARYVERVEHAWGLLAERNVRLVRDAAYAEFQRKNWHRNTYHPPAAYLAPPPRALFEFARTLYDLPKNITPGRVQTKRNDGSWS